MALKEPKMNNPRRQPGVYDYRCFAALKELKIKVRGNNFYGKVSFVLETM
jgi:hypothetical protein